MPGPSNEVPCLGLLWSLGCGIYYRAKPELLMAPGVLR